MLAEKNTYIGNTIVTFHEMTEDEKIRAQYEARERYEWDLASATATGLRKGRQEGRKEGRKEGREEGRKEGREEGETQKLISLICRKLQKHKTPEVIAEELEEELPLIQQICEIAESYAPAYKTEDVFEAYRTCQKVQ